MGSEWLTSVEVMVLNVEMDCGQTRGQYPASPPRAAREIIVSYAYSRAQQGNALLLMGTKQDRWTLESLGVELGVICRDRIKSLNDNDNFVMDQRLAA